MTPNIHEFNKDELEAPKWLNENFIFDVLKHNEQTQDIKIRNLKISPATAKGDHYASVMFRIQVYYNLNGKDTKKSMIMKSMPEYEGNKMDMLQESHIFETEIGMYTEVIPKFESILQSVGDQTILGAKCLYHSLSPRKVIIFEDIVPLGYEVLRGRLITLEEVKATYNKLAKLHAISYKILSEEPQFFDKFRYGIFNEASVRNMQSFQDSITNFLKLLDEHNDLKNYKKFFKTLEGNSVSQCETAFSEYRQNPQSSAFYVLCHGDFHCKNMMFKHNTQSGDLEDVMLLDYQFSYIGPIGNDIMYSKMLLLSDEQRAENFDEILYDYFKVFQHTLQKIGFKGKIPKIIELRKQLFRHTNFELFLMFSFLPMWKHFTNGTIDAEEIIGSADVRKELYKDPNYLAEVRRLLPKYLHLGYLEEC